MKQKYLHTLKKYLIKLSSTGWKQSQMDVYRIRRRFPDAAYLLIQDAVYCWRPVSVDLNQDDCLHPFFIHYNASGTHSLFYFRKNLSASAVVTGMVHNTQRSMCKLGNETLGHASNPFKAVSVLILVAELIIVH